jgi:hypothetical protein
VMDLPRTADSVIHCTWQPQNPSETPPGPAWIGHVRSDNIVEIKSFLTRYHCVETQP